MFIQTMSNGRSSSRKFALLAAVGLTTLIVSPRSASAALELSLDGGAPVVDNGAGDSNPTTGVIVNTATVAGFVVTVSVASSNSPGNTASGQISIASLDITNATNAGPATLMIQTSDTGFTAPGGALSLMNLQSSVSGTFTANDSANDSVNFISFADPANGQPAAVNGTPLITINNAPPSTNGTNNGSFTRGADPYSLSDTITVTLAAGDTANITGTTTATTNGNSVPEPTLGVVPALAVGLLARRRRNTGKSL